MTVPECAFEGQFPVQHKTHGKGHFSGFAIAYQNNGGSFFGYMNSLAGGDFRTGGLDHQINAFSSCKFIDLFFHLFLCSVDHSCGSQFHGFLETFFHDIHYIYLRDSSGLKSHHRNKSDAPGTHYHRFLPQMGVPLDSCMEPHRKGLDKGAFQSADIIRKFKAKICLMSHIFLKNTVYRRCGKEYYVRTEIISAGLAEFAMPACLSRLQGNSVSYFQMFYLFPYFYYCASRFMSQHKRRFYHIISDGPAFIIVKIASADPHIFQFY